MYDETLSPPQTLYEGERVEVAESIGDYDGWNYIAKGALGTVLGYATPGIKRNQAWSEETYWVRLDGDASDSRGRALDRRVLLPLGPA